MAVDESVVSEVQNGDYAAFTSIYEKYFDRIYRYVLVRIGNHAEAEDLAADVFLKAFEKINSFKARGLPFAAWLFRIAHNIVVDHHRRRSRRPTTTLEDDLPLTTDGPHDLVAMGLEIEDVLTVMKEITDAQRQVIAMRFGAGLSIQETADALGKKEGAIKAMQHSAVQALRRHLVRMGHEVGS